MKFIKWKSRGYTYQFSDEENALFQIDFSTFESSASGVFNKVRSPNQNGSTTYNRNLSETNIRFDAIYNAWIQGSPDQPVGKLLAQERVRLSDAFNPLHPGTLTYQNDYETFIIQATPVALPSFAEEDVLTLTVKFEFSSDAAYWEKEKLLTFGLGKVDSLFELPFTSCVIDGPDLELGISYNERRIINNGYDNIYPIITFYESMTALKITNLSMNQYIQVNKAIASNQKMVVNTKEYTAKIYEKSGDDWKEVEDASFWITLDSDYFCLVPGENILYYAQEGNSSGYTVIVEYREPAYGV